MKRRNAFTLVELLVVIAIISILIAILLPVLKGVRHRFMVLACPIAYIGEDFRVHLTDPQGKYDLAFQEAWGSWLTRIAWSPSGQRIGFTYYNRSLPGSLAAPAVLSPTTGQVKPRGPGHGFGDFLSWIDSERFLEVSDATGELYLWQVEPGNAISKINIDRRIDCSPGNFSGPLPVTCAPWTFVTRVGPENSLAMLRKDLTVGRRIPSTANAGAPQIDPLGEMIAWSDANGDKPWSIAIRPLNAPASTPTTLVKMESQAWVCDWTEDDRVLVNVKESDGKWSLYLVDKNGQNLRKIPTAVRPTVGPVAAYRKYGHR